MDRLTIKGFKFDASYVASHLQSFPIAQALNRLSAYEDTGLTNDEITAMQAELAELRGKIERGELIRLPYAPGTVFHQDIKGEYDVTFTGNVAYEVVSGEETEYLGSEDLGEMIEECNKLLEEDSPQQEKRRCRVCGCTDDHACPGGCYWVAPDLCSACASAAPNAGKE
jgi:hypothetical protein